MRNEKAPRERGQIAEQVGGTFPDRTRAHRQNVARTLTRLHADAVRRGDDETAAVCRYLLAGAS